MALGALDALVPLGPLALCGSFRLWRFLALFRRLKASKPERLDAVALWRFGAWRLLHALALLDAFPTPQSLNAWMLWRFGACPTPQSLKASKPECLDALALWRLATLARFGALALGALDALVPLGPLALCGSLTLWRFGALALGALDALVPLGPLALCGSLTLWRFLAL